MKIIIWAFFISITALANEPINLKISDNNLEKVFSYKELMSRKDLEYISIPNDPSYQGLSQTYRAIRLLNLFKDFNLNENQVVQFNCTDGFSAPLDTKLILNESTNKSIAYLAIENPEQKWASLPKKKLSAGPFRVIWLNPEKSSIAQEQWPYMIHSFEIKGSLKASYPNIFPSQAIGKQDPIYKGLKVFLDNCFACHQMNRQGSASIGPDLNIPMNPTEYFKKSALKLLIRNPNDVRVWKTSKMPSFDKNEISEPELDFLIQYLSHMSTNKK